MNITTFNYLQEEIEDSEKLAEKKINKLRKKMKELENKIEKIESYHS